MGNHAFLIAATATLVLGCAAPPHEPTAAPAAPPAVSSASAAPSQPAPAAAFALAAEGDIRLDVAVLEDSLLLHGRKDAVDPWILIGGGTIRVVPPVPAPTGAAPIRASRVIGGSFGGTLWSSHAWNNERQPWASLDSEVFLRRGDAWKRAYQTRDRLCFSVWESPRGCFLGLERDGLWEGEGVVSRVVIDCQSHPPKALRARLPEEPTARPFPRLTVKGLSGGGVAAVFGRGGDGMFLDRAGGGPPLLGVWSREGALRTMPLPLSRELEGSDLRAGTDLRILEGQGGLVIAGALGPQTPDTARTRYLPYAARCDATACRLLSPPAGALGPMTLVPTGLLVITGRDEQGSHVVWAEAEQDRWEKIGTTPNLGDAFPIAIFAPTRDDIWLVLAAPSSRRVPHTWILRNRPSPAPLQIGERNP